MDQKPQPAAELQAPAGKLAWRKPQLTLLSGQSTAGGASPRVIERVIPALTYRPTSF